MLSTAIGVQFNVNDLDANYEVVGTSDNYSFQYNLGKGSDIASFEGEAIQKVISLEGNYGEFDVRVFAASDIGVRSEFIESGISISPPRFDDTFTFTNLRVENLPEDANVGAVNLYEPQTPGDKLEVESEYINKNIQIAWSLIPPVGHAKEGQAVTTELLRDPFFKKFEIILENGTGAQVIDNQTLANSAGMQDTLLTADVTGLLNEYREFSLTLNEAAFQDLDLDRTIGVKIISHDSFGRTATGVLTGINYEPQVEGLSYALRGSDMSFSWFSNDTDFSGVHIQSLAIPSDRQLIYPADIQSSVEYYQDLNAAESWNFGRSEYRSGDMATYSDSVYRAKTNITQSLIDSLGRQNTNPSNSDLWENVGTKFDYQFNEEDIFEESYSTYQVWGYSYYYSFQAIDGYGASDIYNLTDFGLVANRNLKAFTSEVKIGALRYREQGDDLIFNWDIVDQDGTLVDLDKYRFALTNSDVPSILGLSGSLFDSDTKEFLTGITEGDTSKISTVDEFGNRQVVYDLPNTEVFNTYEFTREINNQVYGTGGFLTNYEIFDSLKSYSVGDNVADSNKNIFTALEDTDYQAGEPSVRPFYETWQSSETYLQNDIVEYIGDLYELQQDFGPDSDNVIGVFDTGVNYTSGDLIIYPNADINPYFEDQDYLAGDIVLFNQTFYLALRNQDAEDGFPPNQNKRYWQNISVFDSLDPVIYKASANIAASIDNPYSRPDKWIVQRPDSSEYFSKYISGFNLSYSPWSDSYSYNSGVLVLYANDIWSGIKNSGPLYNTAQVPNSSPEYWTNLDSQNQDIVSDYNQGDLVYYSGAVYQCLSDTPNAAPMPAILNFGDDILSDYLACDWIPFWEKNTSYDGFVYDHVGIPESGKRSVGLEIGIIDNSGQVLNSQRIIGINQEPSILSNGFQVDSLSETTKVKFKFNYAFSTQEKTSKVHLYRSENSNFEITGADGLPFDSLTDPGSTLVKVTLGAADATFGDNITEIFDTPPIPQINGIDQITGYYYKILPFDDFGSGDLYGVNDNAGDLERCLVYPKNYSNKNPNGVPGPVFRTSADDIPGPVKNLNIDTAFENFFISWSHPSGEIITNSPVDNAIEYAFNNNIPNDLSHYEVWSSSAPKLELGSLGSEVFLKSEADPFQDVDFSNNKGYRRIEGNIPNIISNSEPIPIERQDPASGITNAKRIFNVPANGPEIETSYLGKTNETKYFWVRPVDFAGNKGPFTGSANLGQNQEILGFEATLGQASATDIDDFELNMTEIFGNTIALAPQPDPFDGDGSYISWPQHVLYYQGTGYLINGSGVGPNYESEKGSYIWWDNNSQAEIADPEEEFLNVGLKNIYYKNLNYKVSSSHPAGSRSQDSESQDYIDPDPDFGEGDFIVARVAGFPSNVAATPVYHAFANALIGTANIAEAAIVDAKINTLTADKITAGEIKGHEIKVGFGVTNGQTDTAKIGSISSVGFDDLVFDETFPALLNPNISGFSLKADGKFAFQQGSSSLSFENDVLMLRGRIKQTNNKDYDFIELDCTPNYFNYAENEDGYFISDDNVDSYIDITFRNTSIDSVSDIQLRATVVNDQAEAQLFDFNDVNLLDGSSAKYGFEYVNNSFDIDPNSSTVTARVKITPDGFSSGLATVNNADAIAIYIKGKNSTHQKKTTISRIIDGKAAESIRLSATSQTFKVDKYGSIIGDNEITITADVQNTSRGINWTSDVSGIRIYDINGGPINETLNGNPNYVQNKIVKIKFDDFPAGNLKVKINASTEPGIVSPSVSDEMTFIIVEDGSNEVSVVLSNENHTFTETYDSSTGTYSLNADNSGTDIEVFDGAQLLIPKSLQGYNDLQDKKGYYYVTDSSTAGITEDSSPTVSAGIRKITYDPVTISDDSLSSAAITFNVLGTKLNGETFGSIEKKQTFSVSRAGKSSSSIRLSATSQVFKVDKYGSIIGDDQITISANLQNTIDSPRIQWQSDSTGFKIYDSNGYNQISQTTYVTNQSVVIKHDDLSALNPQKVKITATVEQKGSVDAGSDAMTFIIVEDGSNEVSVVLSNENHTFTETYDSSTGTYSLNESNSGTDIEVFDGAQLLIPKSLQGYNDLQDKKGYYYVTDSSTAGITEDSSPTVNITSKKITYDPVTISDDSINSAAITFTVQGTKLNGETFGSIEKKQTFSVSQAGRNSQSVRLSATSQTFRVDKYGDVVGDDEITITANLQNLPGASVQFFQSGGVTLTNTTSDYSKTLRLSEMQSKGVESVKVTATVGTLTDDMTFIIVQDGSNVVSAVLSNETHTLSQYKDSSGNIRINPSLSGTSISVYDGAFVLLAYTSSDYENLTNQNGAYYVTATEANSSLISVDSSPDISTNQYEIDYGNITIIDHSFLRTYIQFDIIGKKNNGEDFAITKIQTFSVSVRGSDGTNGINGTNGTNGEDGLNAVSPTFKGTWKPGEYYTYRPATSTSPGRGDIVYRPSTIGGVENNYFICIESHTSSALFGTDWNSGNGKWAEFGNEFESVATDILLANDAYITNSLIVGNPDNNYGEIKSNGYTSAYAGGDYSTGGFSLIRDSNGNAFFDIGGSKTIGTTQVDSYFRFSSSSGKISLKGTFTNNSSEESIAVQLQDIIDGTKNWTQVTVTDTLATFVGGGYNNSIEIPSNNNNYLSLASAILSGGNNEIKGRFSTVLGGYLNLNYDNFSTICGGYGNTMPEESEANEGSNFIGAGQNNNIQGGTNQSILGGNNNTILST